MITFTKVKLEYGWLGNMSKHKIEYLGATYSSAEALFQALRFNDEQIKEEIRKAKSPMAAKLVAKKNAMFMDVEPTSPEDVRNMVLVCSLKLVNNSDLIDKLKETGNEIIVEDVTSRQHGRNLFWGAVPSPSRQTIFSGRNILGKIWVYLRKKLQDGIDPKDLTLHLDWRQGDAD